MCLEFHFGHVMYDTAAVTSASADDYLTLISVWLLFCVYVSNPSLFKSVAVMQ